ncbi:PREDICTED: pentatricopeptide repeat-containing protein At4g18840-like [Fragaria vesca subsp. vesca]
MVSLISLCGEVGALDLGKWVHSYINQQRIEVDVVLRTALVDMYAKCGEIDVVLRLSSEARNRDSQMWNVMITGLAMHGCGKQALELFEEMQRPDFRRKCYLNLAWLLRLSTMDAWWMLGRAGKLDEAHELIKGICPWSLTQRFGVPYLLLAKLHKTDGLMLPGVRKAMKDKGNNKEPGLS